MHRLLVWLQGRWRACALACLLLPSISTAEDSAPEAALKAAYIFNFTKFVEWPDSVPAGQLRVCVVGSGPVVEALAAFDGKVSMGRTLTLNTKGSNLGQCQLVYLTEANTPRHVSEVIGELKGRPVLTVSDVADFLNLGGMIALSRTGDRLRFEVDLTAAMAADLKIAASLLRMAKTVRQ